MKIKYKTTHIYEKKYLRGWWSRLLWVYHNIIEITYNTIFVFVLFKCEWYDVIGSSCGGYKMDQFGFNSINFKCSTNGPYILATECQQVFYV